MSRRPTTFTVKTTITVPTIAERLERVDKAVTVALIAIGPCTDVLTGTEGFVDEQARAQAAWDALFTARVELYHLRELPAAVLERDAPTEDDTAELARQANGGAQ